jgi:hypothetical protein
VLLALPYFPPAPGFSISTLRQIQALARAGLGTTSLPTGASNPISAAIQTQEGYYPGSLSYQNNNPGNLVASSWTQSQPGYTGQNCVAASNGQQMCFAVFDTLQDGENAMDALEQSYANQGDTIQQMMAAWAGQANAAQYAQLVASAAGVSPSTPVASVLSSSMFSAEPDMSSDATDSNPISDSLGLSAYGVTDNGLLIGAACLLGLAFVFRG